MKKNKSILIKHNSVMANDTEKRVMIKQKSEFGKSNQKTQNKLTRKNLNMITVTENSDFKLESINTPTKFNSIYPQTGVNKDLLGTKSNAQSTNSTTVVAKQDTSIITNEAKTSTIKVIARFRPPNKFEEELSKKEAGSICVDFISNDTVSVVSSMFPKAQFTLDTIFNTKTTQEHFYKQVIEGTITEVLSGYNGTILTYGQSGSGKTHTMFGDLYSEDLKGVIPRSIDQIFDFIDTKEQNEFQLKFSILEIYRENLYDLLNTDTKYSDIKIKEDPKKGIYVDGLTTVSIEEKEEFFAILESAEENRSIAETRLNKSSSRSHVVFMLYIKQKLPDDTEKIGTLNLVDLAGSEKISKTGASGETLEEAKKINQSLSCLGNVINCLTSGNKDFVPYRESKLTRLLKDSLGGNFKTTLIVACSPHSYNAEDTLSTLNFAKRAKNVKNKVKINIKRSPEELERIITSLNEKLRIANAEILRLSSNSVTKETEINSKISMNGFSGDPISFNLGDHPSFVNVNQSSALSESLQAKDNEIQRLKEEIDNLKIENKNLIDDKISVYRILNINHTLESIENSVKKNLSEFENSINKYKFQIENLYLEENKALKTKILAKESKFIDDFIGKVGKELDFNMSNQLQNFNLTFTEFISKLVNEDEDNDYYKNYENIYKNSKLFINDMMKEFLKNPNFFKINLTCGNDEKNQKNHTNNEDAHILKKTFLQMNSMNIFYEKLLFELIGKLTYDLKNFNINQKFIKDHSINLINLNNNFKNYLDLLDEVKQIQYTSQIKLSDNAGSPERRKSSANNNENAFKRKFIRNVTSKNSKNTPGFSVLNNMVRKSMLFRRNENLEEDIFSSGIDTLKLGTNIKQLENIDENEEDKEQQNVLDLSSDRSKENGQTVNSNNRNSRKFEFDKENFTLNPNTLDVNHKSPITIARRSKTKFQTLKHLLNSMQNNNQNANAEDLNVLQELRLLRKEKQINKDFIEQITNESAQMQKKLINSDKVIHEYQQYLKDIYAKELSNLQNYFAIIKGFYDDEIEKSQLKIKNLSSMVDDLLLNKVSKENLNKGNTLSRSYVQKKIRIMNNEEDSCDVHSFASSFINDMGTATKKLDYFLIEMKDEDENNNDFDIVLGSGLDKKNSTKCPLIKNLKYNLDGDLDDQVLTP